MGDNPEHTAPHNKRAEQLALSGMLHDNGVIADVVEVLRVEDFYNHAHQLVFAAVLRLADERGPVDAVAIAEELRRNGNLEDVSYAYLGQLWEATYTGASAVYYAGLVKETAVRRQLIRVGGEIAGAALAGASPAAELLESAERSVLSIADGTAAQQAVLLSAVGGEAMARIEAAADGKPRAGTVATGYFDLDRLTGGLHAEELTIVASRPSVGKSALAANLLRTACLDHRAGALLVTLEMSRVEVYNRLLCSSACVSGTNIRDGTLTESEWEALTSARHAIDRGNVHIDDSPGQRMHRIAATARRLKLRNSVGLLVVDYLQLVEPENRRDPRHEQVAGVARRLKTLAKELKIPVVALAQVNRGAEERQAGRPRLADLKESGGIEEHADNVWLLHRDESRPERMEVIIAKQRNGPTESAWLTWQKAWVRFDSVPQDHERF